MGRGPALDLWLFLRSPPCLHFCSFPALLFLGSSPSLGLQSPCLLLGSLPGLGFRLPLLLFLSFPRVLFNSPTLFRRCPWLIQCFDNLLTEVLDLLPDFARLNVEMTQETPIDILALPDGREDGITAPFGLVFERGNRNVKNRENKVVSTESLFASEK